MLLDTSLWLVNVGLNNHEVLISTKFCTHGYIHVSAYMHGKFVMICMHQSLDIAKLWLT